MLFRRLRQCMSGLRTGHNFSSTQWLIMVTDASGIMIHIAHPSGTSQPVVP